MGYWYYPVGRIAWSLEIDRLPVVLRYNFTSRSTSKGRRLNDKSSCRFVSDIIPPLPIRSQSARRLKH